MNLEIMKSPITGKHMPIQIGRTTLVYKGEKYRVFKLFYVDHDTKIEFSTTYTDTITMDQVYIQYAQRHNVPLADVRPE